MRMRYLVALMILGTFPLGAQEPASSGGAVLEERDRLIRERYEQVLENDPLQEAAFDRVYESYMLTEGVDAWLEKLKPAEDAAETAGSLVLRGRILARQFKAGEAVETLSKARNLGEASPAFNALLGRLYYETGKDADAIALLGAALDATESPEQRSVLCRMLGSVYLRSGQRAEAAAVWERIAELNPNDLFALQELAEIYEENRLWDEAIAARQRIVTAAANDPYRQCHAWRAIGQSLLAKDDHAGAIAAYEQGLALAAPGNWLFEDLKNRLVGVYESRGDLEGLSAYLEARIAQDATDLSLSELLADVTMRRGDLVQAEALLKDIVARSPGRESALEMLIGLYRQATRPEDLAATFEVLIAQYPNEPDYLRRLGEAWLEQKSPEKAQETWRRVVGDGTKASTHALLAEWLERSEFFPEAASAYEAALAIQPEREWRLRVASLKYDMGEEEAALAAWQAAVAAEDTPAGEVAEIAAVLLSKEFKAEAEALYARAMALEPENLDHVLAYARLLSGREDHTGAVAQYTRLAEQDTSEYLKNEGERGLLDAYEALGTLDAQRATWEEAIAQAPEDTVARLKLARLYARMGMRPAVVKLYEECAAIDPERVEFQRLLVTAYKENRQTDKAVAVLEGLMDKDAGRAQAYLRDLLALYGTLGQPQEAIRSAEKLVELSPASPEARTALAQAYLRNGEPEKGLQQYRDLVQIDGTQPAYYRDFGDALQGQGKFGEAQEIYRKMLDAATDDTTRLDAVNRLAAVYVRNGQRDAILSEFQRRVSAAPKSLAAYQELAAVHRASGDIQGALETLERAKSEVEDRDAVLRLLMTEAFQAGDNLKVVAVYEELLARSAQPTPNDLDRLAGAYAQVGRMDEALALWDRIAKENSDDAAMQLMVARQLEQFGFYDESNARTERALEIDPYDYTLRFDYAQRLIGFNEVDRALAQMKAILDIGERPEAPQGSATAGANAALQPGAFPVNLNFGMGGPRQYRGRSGGGGFGGSFGGPGFGGGFGGSRWYGQSFADLRQQVVQSMVHLSRQYEEGEPLIDTYKKRIDEQPENIDARRDYLLVCEASEEHELALEAAKELLAIQPEDESLRWRIFGYLQQLDRADEAIVVAIELAASPNEQMARQAQLMRIRLLAQNSRFEEAQAVLAELTSDGPEMAHIYFQVASSFQNATDPAVADALYQKAAELDPGLRHHAITGRARLQQERGDAASARELYIEAIFEPAVENPNSPVAVQSGSMQTPLYMPQSGRRGRQPGHQIAQLPGFNHASFDHQRAEALNQAYRLAADPEAFAPVIARMREEAGKYLAAESDAQRQTASNFVYFLVSVLRNSEQDGEALGLVESYLTARPGDSFLQNLRLYLLDEQGRIDELNAAYDDIEASNPAASGDVAQAKLQIALMQEDVAAIPALYRALPDPAVSMPGRRRMGVRASQLTQVVRALENAGAKDEARALLEEELARSREPRILSLLAQSHGAAGEHDQAIAYAREVWEKQGNTRGMGGNLHYSMDGMTLQSLGLQGLVTLWNTYRIAGRESELIAEFEGRIEGQPTSVNLRQSLIGLYMENRQYDLARTHMEKLLELRPNDVQLKVRYAGLLESNNDPAGALAVLESVAASRPSAARGISGEIRRLYKDLGKKDELAALDEQLIREARSAEQLQGLARQLAEERDFAKAAELMQKALRIEPDNNWLQTQVGDYLWQADQKNEAVDAYLKFLQPATPRQAIYVDPGQMPQVIQRVDEAGRLEELKVIAAGSQTDPMSARALKILGALIARHEKRLEDAEAILKSVAEGGGDQQVFALLAELAESRNDPAAAIQYLESVTPTGGIPDHRRIAMLHLKTGDTDKSIQSWKKFAEQHGGYFGYEEVIRSFAEAGEDEVLARYFKDIYAKIPANDPARRQLAQSLIQVNEHSGRYDELISTELFSADTKDLGELARQYLGYFDSMPGLALRRLKPIAERFPENVEIQALYAQVLRKNGDIEGAIETYQSIPHDESFIEEHGNRYAELLRDSEDPEHWRDFALARVERRNPSDQDVEAASRVLIELDRTGELAALRDRILANSDPAQHTRLRCAFLAFDAQTGDPRVALDAMKALAESTGDVEVWIRYYRLLLDIGSTKEAVALYREWPKETRLKVMSGRTGEMVRTLLSCGEVELAWDALVLTAGMTNLGEGRQIRQVYTALGVFVDFNVPATTLMDFMEKIRSQDEPSAEERLVLACAEIQLGRWSAALDVIGEHRGEPAYILLLAETRAYVPEELRAELFGDALEGLEDFNDEPDYSTDQYRNHPRLSEESRTRERIYNLGNRLDGENAPKVIAELEAIEISTDMAALLADRAQIFERAGAKDKALADIDALLMAQPENQHAQLQRASLLARSDRLTEAMDVWQASGLTKEPAAFAFAKSLAESGFLDEASTVLEASGQSGLASREGALLRARILQREGDVAAMAATLETIYADLDEYGKSSMANEFGEILLTSGLWKKLLSDMPTLTKPVVLRAAFYIAGRYEGDDSATVKAALADAVPIESVTTRSDALALAQLYDSIGRKDDAIRVLKVAAGLAPGYNASDGDVVNRLSYLQAYDEMARVLIDLTERRPQTLRDHQTGIFDELHKVTDPALREALLDLAIAHAESNAQVAYLNALKIWYGPDRAAGTAALAAIVQAPDTGVGQVKNAVRLLRDAGETELARQGLERLISGEFDDRYPDTSIFSMMSIESDAGNLESVLDLYLRIPTPTREDLGRAWRHLIEAGTSLEFEVADLAIRSRIETSLESPRVSELIALRDVLAAYKGVPAPALELEQLGVSEKERYEATLWSNLVNTWAMRPPVPIQSWDEFAAPLDNDLQSWLRGESVPALFSERWLPVWARQVGPTVDFSDSAWQEEGPLPEDWASDVLTEIESPDDRAITLAFGCTGWARVWVNENEVHKNSVERLYFPDSDQFDVPLKKGRNRVLIKAHVDGDDTAMSLSIIAGGEGLKVCAPLLPGALPGAYPEWARK